MIRSLAQLPRLAPALLALAAAHAPLAHADEARATREANLQLDEEQARLMERLTHLDQVSRLHGRYVLLRDTRWRSDSGLKATADAWMRDVDAWLVAWNELLAIAGAPGGLSGEGVRETLRAKIGAQLTTWQALQDRARILALTAAQIRRDAGELLALPPDFVAGYGDALTALAQQITTLQHAVDVASGAVDGRVVGGLAAVVGPSVDTILARLKKALVGAPDLEQVVAQVDEAFRADAVIAAEAHAVNVAYDTFTADLLASRIFHAEADLATLDGAATAASAHIQAAHFDARYGAPALATIANWQSLAQRALGDKLRSFTRAQIVRSYAWTETRKRAAQCRDGEARKALDCDLLRQLVGVTPEAISTMTIDQLRYLEDRLVAVAKGPTP